MEIEVNINPKEKEEIIRCMKWDISEVEDEIKLMKHSLNLIQENKPLTQNDIHRIIKSLTFDIKSREGTEAFGNKDTELLFNIIHKLKLDFEKAPKNIIPESMIKGRIR